MECQLQTTDSCASSIGCTCLSHYHHLPRLPHLRYSLLLQDCCESVLVVRCSVVMLSLWLQADDERPSRALPRSSQVLQGQRIQGSQVPRQTRTTQSERIRQAQTRHSPRIDGHAKADVASMMQSTQLEPIDCTWCRLDCIVASILTYHMQAVKCRTLEHNTWNVVTSHNMIVIRSMCDRLHLLKTKELHRIYDQSRIKSNSRN